MSDGTLGGRGGGLGGRLGRKEGMGVDTLFPTFSSFNILG